jgi:PadR family transcriptional regulator, regulatory protein PadR
MTELREPTFLVLAALADGRKHGYAIIAEAATISQGRVALKAGTLYTALERLESEGLVGRAGEEVVEGRLRRYYELTDHGAGILADEAARQQQNAAAATARLRSRAIRVAAAQ